jgi:Ca-activated chloride channel family protein
VSTDHPSTPHAEPPTEGVAEGVDIALQTRQERRLIRPTGGKRHVVFSLAVGAAPNTVERPPLVIGLVLDRSGSMHGEALQTAKRTALAVVDQLTASDRASVVVFDDHIDTLAPLAAVTPALKARLRASLAGIEARGSTALHEGWLTGCQTLATSAAGADAPQVTRCFLLTDGRANVGETDPERIASEAAGIRANAGVSTSTLGFGADYDEHLLGPLAVAGGGQFHHLRTPAEIASALTGELGDLLQVAALRVRLEIEASAGMTADVVSAYPVSDVQGEGGASEASEGRGAVTDRRRWSIAVGDLLSGEERAIVVRCGFPQVDRAYAYSVRARVAWSDAAGAHASAWGEARFTSGSHAECDEERRDPAVMRWVGLAHADRAKLTALELRAHGEDDAARTFLMAVARRIEVYMDDDPDLIAAVAELRDLAERVEHRLLRAMEAKEAYSSSLRHSRGQKDFRGQL